MKLFFIGFNKTGTTSIGSFFKSIGKRVSHDTVWPYFSHMKKGRIYFCKADVLRW